MPLIKSSVTCIKLKPARRCVSCVSLVMTQSRHTCADDLPIATTPLALVTCSYTNTHTHNLTLTHTFQSAGNLILISISVCVCGFRWMASCGECDSRVPIWIHLLSLEHTWTHTHMDAYVLTYTADSTLHRLSALSPSWWDKRWCKGAPLSLTLSSLNGSLCWELIWGTLRIPRLHDTKMHTTWLCSF